MCVELALYLIQNGVLVVHDNGICELATTDVVLITTTVSKLVAKNQHVREDPGSRLYCSKRFGAHMCFALVYRAHSAQCAPECVLRNVILEAPISIFMYIRFRKLIHGPKFLNYLVLTRSFRI